jgi:membrane fusion protein, macrolide-specific efflux system
MKNDILQEPRPKRGRMGKIMIFVVVLGIGAGAYFWVSRTSRNSTPPAALREVMPHRGTLQSLISTTGTVLPQNRLQIKPPVNGRVEQVLVKEGEKVKTGQIVAWMSSTDRAALLDYARGQGEKALEYWQDAYKPIPLLAPIDGEVIVATTQPGQAVTTTDAVIVLSNHLIVRAQVDETDIGKIKQDQPATLTLDAYPDAKIKARVEHIYYESQTVNNVTIYNVDLLPEQVPDFFRSGMNANINFIDKSRQDALLVPSEAIEQDKEGSFVMLSRGPEKEPVKRSVKTGMADDKNTEVVSGLDENDVLVVKAKSYRLPKSSTTGTNPFMPARRR